MKQQTKLIVTILIVSVLAITLAYTLFSSTPQAHQKIVDRLTIVDTRSNYQLEPKFVSSDTVELGANLAVFNAGTSYTHSTWVWSRGGETEWAMTVWGPDETGHTYIIEFGRLSPGSFDIYLDNLYQIGFTASWVTPADGYWWMEVAD